MSKSPPSPRRSLKGGLVQVDRRTKAVVRAVEFQYNPEALVHRIARDAVGPSDVAGGPTVTITLTAEFDASDTSEDPQLATAIASYGIAPRLAALRLTALASPIVGGPLTVLVWGSRVIPVKVVEMTIAENAFDARLNPIRAVVSMSLEPLSVAEAGPDTDLVETHDAELEKLAALDSGAHESLGLGPFG
jgi:hypothetical protein